MRRLLAGLVIALSAGSLACGGPEALVPVGDPASSRPGNAPLPRTGEPDDDGTAAGGSGGGGGSTVPAGRLALEVVGERSVQVRVGDRREVAFRLLSDGVPAPDATIDLSIDGDPAGAQLESQTAITGADGVARAAVAAGEAGRFFVVATVPEAPGAEVEVTVARDAPASGSIVAVVGYTQGRAVPLDGAKIHLYDGRTVCAQLLGQAQLPASQSTQDLGSLSGSATFRDLSPDRPVTLFAEGTSRGAVLATGCVEGTSVRAGSEARVTIELQPKAMDVAGTWRVVTTYDLHEALPGALGSVFEVAHDIFGDRDDPARWIVEQVEDATIGFGPLEGTAIDLVDGLLHQVLPASAWEVFAILRDITNTIFGLEVSSNATVTASRDGGFQVTETWDELVYLWSQGCDPRQQACARHRIDLGASGIGTVTTSYLVHVSEDRTSLVVDSHDVPVRYGLLFQILIQEVIYPALAGVHGTGELLQSYVDCWSVAQNLDCDDWTGCDGYFSLFLVFDIDNSWMASACEGALGLVGDAVDGAVGQVGGGDAVAMTLGGQATLVDEPKDLKADRWDRGTLSGTVAIDGGKPITAGMTASRSR